MNGDTERTVWGEKTFLTFHDKCKKIQARMGHQLLKIHCVLKSDNKSISVN